MNKASVSYDGNKIILLTYDDSRSISIELSPLRALTLASKLTEAAILNIKEQYIDHSIHAAG